MKISYADYIKKTDVSVLVAEAIFSELELKYPMKDISEVAKTTSGGTPSRSNLEFYNGDIPWLKSGELNDGIIEEAEEFITEKALANSSAKLLPKDTLLLAMYGATAGKTGITKMETATNQAVCALFPNENVLQEYLFWFLRQYRHKFIEESKGGAQPNISQSHINKTKIPIPEKALQKQIATLLSKIEDEKTLDISIIPIEFRGKVSKVFGAKNTVFEIANELTHQRTLLKNLRQQLLQDAVQGKLVKNNETGETGQDLLNKIKAEKEQLIKEKKLKKEKELPPIKPEEIPFDIPEDWVWCRGEIVANYIDPQPSHRTPPESSDGIPYIAMSDIRKDGTIDLSSARKVSNATLQEHQNRYKLEDGDFIFGKIGTIGKPVKLTSPFNYTLSANVILIQPRREIIDQDYLFYFLCSPTAEKNLIDNKSTMSYPVFGMGKARNMPIPLPPLITQHRIVEKIKSLMQICDILETSIQTSAHQNEQLLQQVLREALQA